MLMLVYPLGLEIQGIVLQDGRKSMLKASAVAKASAVVLSVFRHRRWASAVAEALADEMADRSAGGGGESKRRTHQPSRWDGWDGYDRWDGVDGMDGASRL
jgi:hypothetical protein